MSRISQRRVKRRNRTSKIWVSLIVIVMVGVFSVRSFELYTEGKEYEQKKASLEKQLLQEQQRTQELEEEQKYRQTKKYVEDYAHNQLGLVYPDEIIFKAND